ncbi:methyltransferase [Aureococcus anophagefferens]|nr:methyltransferase [Aureococcus anophagefferens]
MAELPMSCPPAPAPPEDALTKPSDQRDDALAQLLKARGYDSRGFHPSCLRVVRHRIIQRLAVLGVDVPANADGVAAYAALERTAAEDAALDGLLRINFTQWNRNHVFDFLQAQVFRRVADAARGAGDAVRDVAADATDLDGDSLAVARAGRYRLEIASPGDNAASVDSFSDLPEDARAALFAVGRDESDNAETATVKPRFRGSATFSSLDLRKVEGLREGAYHLVFCRHSGFTYLARAERAKLLEAIHAATADQGFLVVGHDERLPAGGAPFFEPVFEEWGVYRRLAAEAAAVDDDDDDERSDDGATFRALYDDSAALDGLRREREALARKVADVLGSRGLGTSLKDVKRRGNGTRVTAASDPQTWVSLTGVASCPTCGFAYVTSNHGAEFWRVSLPEPLAAMAARRDFAGLGNASVAPLALVVDGANLTHSGKLRMADGAAGLQFADDENELLATTMGAVLVLKTRNASAAPRAVKVQSACNGHHARDAVKADGLFYVISGPQQGAGCKGLFEGRAPHAFSGPAKGEVTTVPYDDGLWRRLLGGAPRPRPARPQVGAAAPR